MKASRLMKGGSYGCALSNYDTMQVKFLLQQSIAVSFTLTASSERMDHPAKGNGEHLRRDGCLPSTRRDSQDWCVGLRWYGHNVNSLKLRQPQAG